MLCDIVLGLRDASVWMPQNAMKPAAFEYDAPDHIDEVLELLAEHGDEARVLAGGQSLVPLMNYRLARPARLIDLNRVHELAYIEEDDAGIRVGAMSRQRTLEHSVVLRERCSLITQAVPWIGHAQIRNRGTIGGSMSHADPAAELPVVARALDAKFLLSSASGERWIDAEEFFVSFLTTAAQTTELLSEIVFPILPDRSAAAFVEYARRHGDFALGGAAAVITLDADSDVCRQARISLLGAGPIPERAPSAEAILVGRVIDEAAIAEATEAIEASIEPTGDMHGDSEYRCGLIGTLAGNAVAEANAKVATSR